ncbi:hypothetical protein [Peteryoungia ipomoeae]|uniref:DUF2946 domain-containing protein n=1 Tax=Peteryoungia ipomoeae TaxID=1210932 RepID=A0A4S8PBB6_9HYPH|nr:hypothetical protein [Peteryoungia ipomoeae]THV25349.1 hypothetical protein FAA97_03895 [Peteryoungia ipomoeae]
MKPKVKTAQMILRLFCAMVFLSVGFAHRTPAAIASESQSSAYVLPDGTFAGLCAAHLDHEQSKPANDCQACRLAGSVILPPPSDDSWLLQSLNSLGPVVAVEAGILIQHLLDRPRLRGPPLLL